jgi:large subunit ribosomal protein L17
MRHGRTVNHLGRKSEHRKAMLSNLAVSLIMHKGINTTLAKAKALRTFIEPIITRAKEDTTHNRRIAFSYLKNKKAVSELFREIAQKVADRPGGYTRILRLYKRPGDNATICRIELVDYNENMLAAKTQAKETAKKPRTRRGSKKKKTEDSTAAQTKDNTTNTSTENVNE